MDHPGITFEDVLPVQVFNLPLFEHHLVLDTRPEESFQKESIVSALSFPAPPIDATDRERELGLVKFIIKLVDDCSSPDNASPLVVYGDGTEAHRVHLSWLARRLSRLKHTKLTIAMLPSDYDLGFTNRDHLDGSESTGPDSLELFCNTIAARTAEMWNIDGGYESFKAKYPYLCGNISFADMLPIPYEVTPNLYLGSRAMDYNMAALSTLGVTHIAGASHDRRIQWDQLMGISTLRCDVQDTNHQQMFDIWSAVTGYIADALRCDPNARVLVFFWGRSRSASAILAYLIRGLGYSLEDAQAFLRRICRSLRVDPTLMYQDQLRMWSDQKSLQNV